MCVRAHSEPHEWQLVHARLPGHARVCVRACVCAREDPKPREWQLVHARLPGRVRVRVRVRVRLMDN